LLLDCGLYYSAGAIETEWQALPREARRRDEELAALRAEVERLRARWSA